MVERDGLPIDVGRQQRIVPERLRLALHVRDRFCQFPGCSVPARRTEAHHYEHWAMGGETKLGNLLLLCGFHHRRNHEGAFRISKTIDGYSSEASDVQPIRPATHGPVIAGQHGPPVLCSQHPDIGPETPAALWRGEAMQLSYAVSVIADACEFAEARAAPAS